jgi:hypothetical protein
MGDRKAARIGAPEARRPQAARSQPSNDKGPLPEGGTSVSATARFSGDDLRIKSWITEISPFLCE